MRGSGSTEACRGDRVGVEVMEIRSSPSTPQPPPPPPPSSPPPPSFSRSPPPAAAEAASAPPAAAEKAKSMRAYLEEVSHLTRLDPRDEWLPITESRGGNAYYAAFHTLCAGLGFQALMLPVAFTYLGWVWGSICLLLAFCWQLYTMWVLTQLHESVPGTRYSRYLHLCTAAFGDRLGKWLAMFPIMYLSAGTCTVLIIVGGGSMKLFFDIACGPTCAAAPLTAVEWYLVFVCLAAALSQLPNLNSIAGVSLVAAAAAVSYCTAIWVLSVAKGHLAAVSYGPPPAARASEVAGILGVVNGLGIVAFAFRGHNLTLEIQATLPSSPKHPSCVPMWKGIKIAYTVVAMCLFPVAIGGYWAYGNMVPPNGILTAVYQFHGKDTSRAVLGLTTMLFVVNCLTSFQIYAMPVFDDMESGYIGKRGRRCPRLLRAASRVLFGFINFFIAVAFPFLANLAGLIGAVSLPVTLAYPCFMYVVIKRPERNGVMWCVNLALGCLGLGLSVVLVAGGVWGLVVTGLKFRFFKAQP